MLDVWYWAVLETNSEGAFFAHIPDLPGVTATGASEKEALILAAEFATDYVSDLVADGHPVPPARDAGEIEHDPEVREYGRALVPVDIPGRSVKVSLSFDESLLARVDRAAKQVGESRSGFLASAALQRLRTAQPKFDQDEFLRSLQGYTLGQIVEESIKRGK